MYFVFAYCDYLQTNKSKRCIAKSQGDVPGKLNAEGKKFERLLLQLCHPSCSMGCSLLLYWATTVTPSIHPHCGLPFT